MAELEAALLLMTPINIAEDAEGVSVGDVNGLSVSVSVGSELRCVGGIELGAREG